MDKKTFIENMRKLIECQKQANIVSDAFGCDIDCEGFIGDLIDGYGTLILRSVTKYREIPDDAFDSFWNAVCNDEDLTKLYDDLTRLN